MAEVPAHADATAIQALAHSHWLDASVPGSAHGVLLVAGRIPDPFHAQQEADVQWVGERTWAWRTTFDVDTLAAHEELVFEGLDTWCTVWLNGQPLLTSDNMFVPQRVDVRSRLRPGRNELLLRFDPALDAARELQARHGQRALWNGDSARLYARKAQYHFGWDWGPVLLTSGPWRPVRRHSWQVRIEELHCQQQLDLAGRRATLSLRTRLAGEVSGTVISHQLLAPDGQPAGSEVRADGGQAQLQVSDARLWWPHNLGAQPLYTLVTRVSAGDVTLAEDRRRIGLRTLRLVQAPVAGEHGCSFCFEVNGQDFFVGGANWIPEDSLLERISPARYRERVAQAIAGNLSMLRVWGGGIYEDEAFYDACDELGVLVWQDFMFACGMYPAHAAFQDSVRAEARAAVLRLRHRASLALWCGNNEDYAVAESIGAHGPGVPPDRFEARALYEQLLPGVCARLDPGRPYWPGSPYSPDAGGITLSSDPTVGDRHSWEVWHQQMLPYQRYGEVQARFVSEFGMQSHASLALLQATLPAAEQHPFSQALAWHNKAGSGQPDGHRRLAVYLADNLAVGPTLPEHVYATQFVQAEAMRYAYQDFRRRWQRPGARAVGGALVWQLNDCWPATSWALIDSAGTLKPAWHTVRRAMAPLAVALRLQPQQACMAVMNQGPARRLTLALRVFSLDGRCLHDVRVAREAPAHTSTECEHALPDFGEPVVGELRVLADQQADEQAGEKAGERELARDCAWPEPFRFFPPHPAKPSFHVEGQLLRIRVDVPVKGLWLQAPGTGFADNFIDAMPGPAVAVALQGDTPCALQWLALGQAGSAALNASPEAAP